MKLVPKFVAALVCLLPAVLSAQTGISEVSRLQYLVQAADDKYSIALDKQRDELLLTHKRSDPVPPAALAEVEKVRHQESRALEQFAGQIEVLRKQSLTSAQVAADNGPWAKVLADIAMPDKAPATIGAIARQRKFGPLLRYLKQFETKEAK